MDSAHMGTRHHGARGNTYDRWPIVIVAAAVCARVACIVVLQSHLVPRSTYEHGEIAANLVGGRGFSMEFLGATGPTSQQAPVYPFVVAAAYLVGGVESPRSLLMLELVQALLGGVMVAGVMALAQQMAPGRVGIERCAGMIAALHPTLVYCVTHVQVSCLAATSVVWSLVLARRVGERGHTRDAIATGAILAFMVLTDPILGLVAPALIWSYWQASPRSRPSVRPLVWLGLAAFIGIAPWLIRNFVVHGEFVFVKSTFGYAFWQGNCRISQGTDKVVRPSVETVLNQRAAGLAGLNRSLWAARHEAGYIDDIALTAEDKRILGAKSEPERSRTLLRRAWADLRSDPGRYLRLCGRRFQYFWLFDETNPKTRNVYYRVSHLGLTLAACAGLVLMSSAMRRRLLPTLLVIGLVTLFHALTIVSARFHVPLEPLLCVFAGGVFTRPRAVHEARAVAAHFAQPRRLTVS